MPRKGLHPSKEKQTLKIANKTPEPPPLSIAALEKRAEVAMRSVGSKTTTFTTPNPEDASTNLVWFLSTPHEQFVLKINSDPFIECIWTDGNAAQGFAELGFTPPSTIPVMGKTHESHPLISNFKTALSTSKSKSELEIKNKEDRLKYFLVTPLEIFMLGCNQESLLNQFKDSKHIKRAIQAVSKSIFDTGEAAQIKEEIEEVMTKSLNQSKGQFNAAENSLKLLKNGKCVVMTMVRGQNLNEIAADPVLLDSLISQDRFLENYAKLVASDIFLGNTDRAAINRIEFVNDSTNIFKIRTRIEGNNNNVMFIVDNDQVQEMVPIDQGILSLALYADFQGNQNLEKALQEYSATWDLYLNFYHTGLFHDTAVQIYNGLPNKIKLHYISDLSNVISNLERGLKAGFEIIKSKGSQVVANLEIQLESDLKSGKLNRGSLEVK
ncbi:MAG: hypothetical protein EXS67_05805, partial [Candidatus Margulisbacteria bacterium]|nr:hypothetical protein [Candidatus Margulisiibacteriota bacterium]